MSTKVLIADDHGMMREGLRRILEQAPDISVVGEAKDGRMTIDLVNKLSPQVVLMDVAMSDLNGIEATRQIKARCPRVKVVGLSAFADRSYVLGMFEAGASGYVLKSSAGDELLRAIEAVARNKRYLSPEVAETVIDGYLGRLFPGDFSVHSILGARECEVLQLVAEGKSSKEIGARLHLSAKTVEAHRQNIMRKLKLHSIAELTKYAIREGLTRLEN